MNAEGQPSPFALKDCDLAEISIGRRAQNLRELRDGIQSVDTASIYYHFWGGLLRPGFVEPEYNNDFAAWASHGLHDSLLAERLGAVDPTYLADMDAVRTELIDVIEEHLDISTTLNWARPDQLFYFMRSQIVIFDTHKSVATPEEMAQVVPRLTEGSIFYHFIDSRRREPIGIDDFRTWLTDFGESYEPLAAQLSQIDPYFDSLARLRTRLTQTFEQFFAESAK